MAAVCKFRPGLLVGSSLSAMLVVAIPVSAGWAKAPTFNSAHPEQYYLKTRNKTEILDRPGGNVIAVVPSGDGLEITEGYENGYWWVRYAMGGSGVVRDEDVHADDKARDYFEKKLATKRAMLLEQAQKDDELARIRDELKLKERERQQLLLIIQAEKSSIETREVWVSRDGANVRDKPSQDATRVDQLGQGSKVFVQAEEGDWALVMYDGRTTLSGFDNVEQFIETYKRGWIHVTLLSETIVNPIADSDRRRMSFVNSHLELPERYRRAILNGEIMLGMSAEMARASWGEPRDINRTVNAYGVREQWVYRDAYLYFEDSVLVSWQD